MIKLTFAVICDTDWKELLGNKGTTKQPNSQTNKKLSHQNLLCVELWAECYWYFSPINKKVYERFCDSLITNCRTFEYFCFYTFFIHWIFIQLFSHIWIIHFRFLSLLCKLNIICVVFLALFFIKKKMKCMKIAFHFFLAHFLFDSRRFFLLFFQFWICWAQFFSFLFNNPSGSRKKMMFQYLVTRFPSLVQYHIEKAWAK